MPENKKLLSDFQNPDCSPPPPRELDPSAPCPTCIPNPNFVLETDWWSMTEGWIDEKTCEYKFNFNVKLFDESHQVVKLPRYGDEWKTLRNAYAVEWSLKELLKHFNKLVNDDVLKELKLVTIAEEDYVHPEYDIEAVLISLPALNFDRIDEAPLDEEELQEETADAAINLDEIILVGDKLYSQTQSLHYALSAYEFFYSAFYQVKRAVISEKDNPTNRISYSQAKIEIKEFRSVLNSILWKNKFKKLRAIERYSALRKPVDRIKIVFETDDDKPFNIKQKDGKWQVYAKAKDGCGDWVHLENSYKLNKYTQTLAFLARIEDIMVDLEARETKPWLEFTLEYFFPLMTVDYGLGNGPITDDQKSALACLLEKELGLGRGKALDSLISNILSPLEIWANKQAKNACKTTQDRIEKGSQSQKEEEQKPDKTREQIKKEEMIQRFQKQCYNNKIKEAKEELKGEGNDSPTDYDALKRLHEWWAIAAPNQKEMKRTLMQRCHTDALVKYNENIKDSTWYDPALISNSPFADDVKTAWREKMQQEMTVVDSLKETYAAGKEAVDERSFQDFLNVFGICGVSKVSGKALECLLGGMSLDAFLSEAIRKVFEYMEIGVFIKFYNSIPMNIRRAVDEVVKEEFGDVNIGQLLGFVGEQQPSANLRFVSGHMTAAIDRVLTMIEKNDSPILILDPDKTEELETLGLSDGTFWTFQDPLGDPTYYNYELSSYVPAPMTEDEKPDIKKQNKTKRKLKRIIRKAINTRDKEGLNAAKDKFKGLFGQTPAQDELQRASVDVDHLLKLDVLRIDTANLIAAWNDLKTTRQLEADAALQAWGRKEINPETGEPMRYRVGELLRREEEQIAEQIIAAEEMLDDLEWTYTEVLSTSEPDISRIERLTALYKDIKNNTITAAAQLAPAARDIGSAVADRGSLTYDEYANAIQDYEETNIGVKIDKLVGAVFTEIVESLFDIMPEDNLWDFLRQFPVPDMVINALEMLFKNCPSQPLFHPPAKDFLKSLKVDICDPSIQLHRPKVVLPSIDWKFIMAKNLWNKLDDILMEILKSLIIKMLLKILDTLDGAVCKALEALGRIPGELLEDKDRNIGNAWYKALDKAFCGEDDDEHKKSKDLTNAVFNTDRFAAAKAANIIASVAGQDEILNSIIAEDQSEQDGGFNTRVANAINALADESELLALLGSPSKVGYFMMKLGSFLPKEDKDRIRALLDEGVPNLPLTSAICLTDDQLEQWNRLRNQLLRDKGLSPEDAQAQVNRLNQATLDALGDILDLSTALQTPGGPFLGAVQDWYGDNRYPNGTGLDGQGGFGGGGPPSSPDDIYGDDEPCQDGTPIKDQLDEREAEEEREEGEESFKALTDFIKKSYFKRGGLFNEALRDTEGRTLKQHSFRVAREVLWSNYANSEDEWDAKYNGEDTGRVLKAIMKVQAGADGPTAEGIFPQTVGIYLKEQLQAPSGHMLDLNKIYSMDSKAVNSKDKQLTFNPPGTTFDEVDIILKYPKDNANIELKFILEEKGEKPKHKPYEFNVKSTFNIYRESTFDYYSYINSRIDPSHQFSKMHHL